jgi:hypothetical protein
VFRLENYRFSASIVVISLFEAHPGRMYECIYGLKGRCLPYYLNLLSPGYRRLFYTLCFLCHSYHNLISALPWCHVLNSTTLSYWLRGFSLCPSRCSSLCCPGPVSNALPFDMSPAWESITWDLRMTLTIFIRLSSVIFVECHEGNMSVRLDIDSSVQHSHA